MVLAIVGTHDRRLWALFLGRLVTSIGHGLSFPFLGVYFTAHLGVPAWITGAVFSAAALSGAAAKYAGGTLSDRIGRKAVLLLALAGRCLTTVGLAVFAFQEAPLWFPMAALFVGGSMFGFLFEPASQAMVADLADPRSRLAGYGLMRVGGNLGWGIGVLGGGLIGEASFAWAFLTTSVVLAAAWLIVQTLVSETAVLAPHAGPPAPGPDGWRGRLALLGAPGFLLLCGITVGLNVVFAQLTMPLSVHAERSVGLSADRIGLLFAMNAALIVLLQFPASRWVETRFRLTTTLVLGSFLFAAGYASVGVARGFGSLAGAVALFTCGELLVVPASTALAANLAPEDRRGLYLGVFGLAGGAGRCLGPLLGGFDLDLFRETPWVHWAAVGAVGLASSLGFLSLRGRVDRAADLA